MELKAVDDSSFKRNVASFLARRSALLQICSNPVSISPGYRETAAKVAALDRLLDDLIRQRGEKVVLWSFYTASINAIVSRYAAYNPVRYDGAVSDVTVRRDGVRRFQEDDSTMLFVANPAAAGAGITLHRARYAIYESFPNQAAHYLQSLDRIHRRGQERPVEYLILLCDRTVDIDEYERLVRKQEAASDLLGDQTDPPVSREFMLAEAISLKAVLDV
jgi:SNF2 family DNA or RNA helicase